MVYAEATTVLPLMASYAYHKGSWKKRKIWQLAGILMIEIKFFGGMRGIEQIS